MSLNTPYFGLEKSTYIKVLSVLSKFDEIIESCILFGSRARGDNKNSSDFDFAIKVKPDMDSELYKVSEAFEESNIVYTFDIINFNTISNDLCYASRCKYLHTRLFHHAVIIFICTKSLTIRYISKEWSD